MTDSLLRQAAMSALWALDINDRWHYANDEHGGYPESELCDQTQAAIATLRTALAQQAAQPVAQEPRVCWLIEEFSDSGNSTGRYMQDQNDLTITTDAQKARQFLRSRTATFRATDMREKWGTAWRPVSHVFRAAQPQQATDKIGGAA